MRTYPLQQCQNDSAVIIPCRVIISRQECRCMLCSETEEASMALAERLRAEDEEAQLQRQVQDAADAKFAIAMHKIE